MDEKIESLIVTIESRLKKWVSKFVIELNLCPFAKHVVDAESVRYKVSMADTELDLMRDLESEFNLLEQNNDIATSLLVVPFLLEQFDDYLDFLDSAEQLLQDSELCGIYQLASFHPLYQFAGTAPNAPENFSNRAPFPTIHILRESQVEQAVKAYGDTSTIPTRNIAILKKMARKQLQQYLS